MMKFKVVFSPATLPYSVVLHVIAPSEAAARKFIRRESPGCAVVSVEETDAREVYAESDAQGRRL